MTIFGFNTNVQHGDVVYHVESQARQSDLLLQTLVFVKGQCMGKHAFSYAAKTLQAGFSEAAMHELLKAQHKAVVDAVQRGQVDLVLGSGGEIEDVGASGLALKWTNPSEHGHEGKITMRLQVFDFGQPVAGAAIAVWPCVPSEVTELASSITDATGSATMEVSLTAELLRDAALMARATHGEKSATRKFRLHR